MIINKKFVFALLFLLVFFLGGVSIFFIIKSRNICFIARVENDTFEAGWEAAKKRLIESGYYDTSGDKYPIKTLSGVVKKKDDYNIEVIVKPLSPLAEQDLDTRIVNITGLKLYKMKNKSDDQYKNELANYQTKLKNNPEPDEAPPIMFIKEEIPISSLGAGQSVIINSDEDIRHKKEVSCFEIILVE